jgi:hypothetical protein
VLVDVDREDRDHVVDGPEVLGVHHVVEDRPVVEVVADHAPAACRQARLAHGVLPHLHAAGVLGLEQLGEAALRVRAARAAEVAEVQVVVLEAEQRERVVVGRQRAQLE